MAFVQSLLLSPLLLAGLKTHAVSGYTYSTGPILRNNPRKAQARRINCSSDSVLPNNEASKQCDGQTRKNVDRAFSELKEELGDHRESKDDELFNWMAAMTAASMDGGQAKDLFETIDKQTAKKWIEKAFDLAFEFNQDFTNVEGERDATEEILRKSRDWVAGLYEEEDEKTEEHVTNTHDESSRWSSSHKSNTSPVSPEGKSDEPEKETAETASETPDSENWSNEKVFEVTVDLPGVDRTDVDISVEDDYLLVRAKRKTRNEGEEDRLYTIEIPFSENEVDMDNLEAIFKNGVLVVSAPKLEPRKEKKRKIPISY